MSTKTTEAPKVGLERVLELLNSRVGKDPADTCGLVLECVKDELERERRAAAKPARRPRGS